jgi:amino-acid N-acetyltransferase
VIRKAKVADVEAMARIVNNRASLGELLPRSQHHIYQNLRDFVIRALAVAGPCQGQGIGTAIVRTLVDEARLLGLETVFAFTYKPGFFERLGFHLVDKETLPRKVWGECINCVKFPTCDEVALVFDLAAVAASEPETGYS